MQESTTHCLLLKTTDSFATGTDLRWLEVLRAHFACEITLQSVATVKAENNQPMHHVYLHFEKPLQLNPEDVLAVEKIWHSLSGHKANVSVVFSSRQCVVLSCMSVPDVQCHEYA
jgi:hypothetical protein